MIKVYKPSEESEGVDVSKSRLRQEMNKYGDERSSVYSGSVI